VVSCEIVHAACPAVFSDNCKAALGFQEAVLECVLVIFLSFLGEVLGAIGSFWFSLEAQAFEKIQSFLQTARRQSFLEP